MTVPFLGAKEIDFTALSPQERLFHEHVHALYQEVHHTAMTAPNGHVLAQAETAAVFAGRKFVKELLETALQDRIEIAEQERPACPVCSKKNRKPAKRRKPS